MDMVKPIYITPYNFIAGGIKIDVVMVTFL
jgi:hypothetical protein